MMFFCLLAAATVCGCDRAGSPASAETSDADRAPARTPVAAVEVGRRDLSRQLSTSGVVAPRVTTRLASRASGTVDAVYFEEGDRVEAGETLVSLDMSEERAELARALAEEQIAESEYERVGELLRNRIVSDADYDRARATMLVARSERELRETRVAFGRINAPHDAIVTVRSVEPGEAVEARDTLFELVSMDQFVIRLGVSEMDVVHMRAGQDAPVRLDAMPELSLEGRIRRIFPTADSVSRLITVEVELPSNAYELGIRPGYLGRVRFIIDPRPDVIAAPAAAIGEDGSTRYVYVIEDEKLVRREIETGVTRSRWTEVVSGLEVGEVILATSPIDMSGGMPVRIVGWRG